MLHELPERLHAEANRTSFSERTDSFPYPAAYAAVMSGPARQFILWAQRFEQGCV